MNMDTGKLTRTDFDRRGEVTQLVDGDIGLVLAMYRHEGIDVSPPTEADVWPEQPKLLAWKCNQGRGPDEHVTQVPPTWFGRSGRGPVAEVEPRKSFPSAALCFWASYGVCLVALIAGIAWVNT